MVDLILNSCRSGKGGLISLFLIWSHPQNKWCEITVSQLFNLKWEVEGQWFCNVFLRLDQIEKHHSKLIRLYSIRSLKSLKFIYLFWEGHYSSKQSSNFPWHYSIVSWDIFPIFFLVFSDYMNFTCNAVNILASVFQFNDKTMDPNFTGACFIDLELDRKLKLVKNKSNSLRKSSNLLWHCGNIKKSLDTFSIFFWPSQNIWTLPETPSTYWPQYSNSMTRPWTPIFQEPVLLTWSLTGNPSWFRFFQNFMTLLK